MFIIAIDTNTYAGGFERQLASYITGVEEEYKGRPWADLGLKTISKDLQQYFTSFLEYEYLSPNKYENFCGIFPNPNWVNNGRGKESKKDSISAKRYKKKYPAYYSVSIYVSKPPTLQLLKEIQNRAKEFFKLPELEKHYIPKDIEIENVRIVERIVSYKDVDIN